MKHSNLLEIEKIINETGDYTAINKMIESWDKTMELPNCFVMHRYDLYQSFQKYHHHDIYEIIYVIDGNISFFIEEKKYELTNGDMALIPPNSLHKLVYTDNDKCRRVIINFTEEYCDKISTNKTNILNVFNLIKERGMHKISFYPEKRKILEKTFEVMEHNQFEQQYGSDLRFDIGFIEVMLLINRLYMNLPEEDLIQKNFNNPYIVKTIEYVNEHIDEKIQLNDIANSLSLSVSRLSHLFKEITGISIISYIIKKRLILAKELLKSGEPIKYVYLKCGFPDESSFYRFFKKEFNYTPKKYLLTLKHE